MMSRNSPIGRINAWVGAVVLHALLALALWLPWSMRDGAPTRQMDEHKATPSAPVQARLIDENALHQEISRLNAQDKQIKVQQRRAHEAAMRAQQLRQQEEVRLKALQSAQQASAARAKAKQSQIQAALERMNVEMREKASTLRQLEKKNKQAQVQAARLADEKARLDKQAHEKARALAALAKKQRIMQEKQRQRAQQEAKAVVARAQHAQLELARYGHLVRQKVTKHWLVQGSEQAHDACLLKVRLGLGGIVLDVIVLESSGSAALDRSAINAVYKSSPLPVPSDDALFERMRELRITLRPDDIVVAG